MAMQFSTTIRNDWLDRYEVTIGTAPLLRIYTGAQPADCATAASGTLLAEATLPSDWMAAAASGSKAKSGTWSDASANNTGTAGYFRIYDSTGTTAHHQGSVGASGTDMIVDSTSFTAGQTFTVNTFTLTAPGA